MLEKNLHNNQLATNHIFPACHIIFENNYKVDIYSQIFQRFEMDKSTKEAKLILKEKLLKRIIKKTIGSKRISRK